MQVCSCLNPNMYNWFTETYLNYCHRIIHQEDLLTVHLLQFPAFRAFQVSLDILMAPLWMQLISHISFVLEVSKFWKFLCSFKLFLVLWIIKMDLVQFHIKIDIKRLEEHSHSGNSSRIWRIYLYLNKHFTIRKPILHGGLNMDGRILLI